MTLPQRYQKALDAGVDIFSGTADPAMLLETVKSGLVTKARINESVARLLREKFELGLFENPYVDAQKAQQLVGNAQFQQKADLAHCKSIVLLRNADNRLPLPRRTKVYFETYYDNGRGGNPISVYPPSQPDGPLEFVADRASADVVLLWLIPNSGGLFSSVGKPIELSLFKNRIDMEHVNGLIQAKPTIVAINFSSPWVLREIEPGAKTILATFGTTPAALIDIVSGVYNPTGKLPFTIPVSEQVVADNKSDVPGNQEPAGYSLFKFGHGLRYNQP